MAVEEEEDDGEPTPASGTNLARFWPLGFMPRNVQRVMVLLLQSPHKVVL